MKIKSIEQLAIKARVSYESALDILALEATSDTWTEQVELDLTMDDSKNFKWAEKVAKALGVSVDAIINYALLSAMESGALRKDVELLRNTKLDKKSKRTTKK